MMPRLESARERRGDAAADRRTIALIEVLRASLEAEIVLVRIRVSFSEKNGKEGQDGDTASAPVLPAYGA